MQSVVSIDIGSTYTKGALLILKENKLKIARATIHPTTVDRLADGFAKALSDLDPPSETKITYSSSAKGGLAITSIGIVPDLTLKMAREAAVSAGGRVTNIFSYKFSSADIRELQKTKPDVILLTGGTDGGNEDYPLHNARKLAESSLGCPIIYAGNRSVEDEVAEILHKKTLTITENVLPSIDRPNPIPAKEAIREVFLNEIVKGKGLDEVMAKAGEPPRPTPLAMLEFVQLIAETRPDFGDFCLIDMGGATTDFYSTNKAFVKESVLFKGLPEPHYKRSVEADLGMRVTAQSAIVSADSLIREMVETEGLSYDEFKAFVDRISENTFYLPIDKKEMRFDSILAAACFTLAVIRHAGVQEQIFSVDGERLAQYGKDLREIKKIIGTGGYLSRFRKNFFRADSKILDDDRRHLVPRQYTYYVDAEHYFPVLANASLVFPEAAVDAAIKGLERVQGSGVQG